MKYRILVLVGFCYCSQLFAFFGNTKDNFFVLAKFQSLYEMTLDPTCKFPVKSAPILEFAREIQSLSPKEVLDLYQKELDMIEFYLKDGVDKEFKLKRLHSQFFVVNRIYFEFSIIEDKSLLRELKPEDLKKLKVDAEQFNTYPIFIDNGNQAVLCGGLSDKDLLKINEGQYDGIKEFKDLLTKYPKRLRLSKKEKLDASDGLIYFEQKLMQLPRWYDRGFVLKNTSNDLLYASFINDGFDIPLVEISHEIKPVLLDDFVLLVKELQKYDHQMLINLYHFSVCICQIRIIYSPEYVNHLCELYYHFFVLLRLYYDIPRLVKEEDVNQFKLPHRCELAHEKNEGINFLGPMKQFKSGQWYIFGRRFIRYHPFNNVLSPEVEVINPQLGKRKFDP